METNKPAIIYCDESNHTGNNLLDKDQHTFLYATVHISEDEAKKYLEDLQNNIPYIKNMKEIKSKIIPHNKQYFIDFFEKLKQNIKINIINKKYALACKEVETIVEPVISRFSSRMYSTGLQNMLATLFWVELDDEFHETFSDVIRKKSNIDIIEKYKNNKFIGKFLITNKDRILDEMELLSKDKWSLDMSVTSLHTLLTLWHQELQQQLKVIYDESKPISDTINIFDSFKYDTFTPFSSKINGHDIIINYHLSEIEAGNSKEHSGLIIADLAAGILKLGDDDIINKLNIDFHGILPYNEYFISLIHRDFLIVMAKILLNESQAVVANPDILFDNAFYFIEKKYGKNEAKRFIDTFFKRNKPS